MLLSKREGSAMKKLTMLLAISYLIFSVMLPAIAQAGPLVPPKTNVIPFQADNPSFIVDGNIAVKEQPLVAPVTSKGK